MLLQLANELLYTISLYLPPGVLAVCNSLVDLYTATWFRDRLRLLSSDALSTELSYQEQFQRYLLSGEFHPVLAELHLVLGELFTYHISNKSWLNKLAYKRDAEQLLMFNGDYINNQGLVDNNVIDISNYGYRLKRHEYYHYNTLLVQLPANEEFLGCACNRKHSAAITANYLYIVSMVPGINPTGVYYKTAPYIKRIPAPPGVKFSSIADNYITTILCTDGSLLYFNDKTYQFKTIAVGVKQIQSGSITYTDGSYQYYYLPSNLSPKLQGKVVTRITQYHTNDNKVTIISATDNVISLIHPLDNYNSFDSLTLPRNVIAISGLSIETACAILI